MKTPNSAITAAARQALAGKWGLCIGVFIVYFLIVIAIQNIPKVGGLLGIIISGPFALGIIIFFLAVSRNQNPKFEQLFDGFKRFGTALATYLLITLFTILWTLLLIIPGIIASLAYSMTLYIIVDDHTIGALDAIRKSKQMMRGNKWRLVCLHFRFLGWLLLCIPTLGIGLLWLVPYMQVTEAKFYDDVKGGAVAVSA